MLEPQMLPPVCPTCGRAFLSWPSVSRHLRLDHTPEREEEGLTVAEILAARADDQPPSGPVPPPAPDRTAGGSVLAKVQGYVTQPWALGLVVWLGALYGLSHLGIDIARLVAWSFVLAAVLGAIALQAWGRAELQLQQDARRKNGPTL